MRPFLLTLLFSAVLIPNAASARPRGPLGRYGFLTNYHCQPDSEARERIRTMATQFGIREFQFYDWFADYETPTRGTRWTDPFFHKREICLRTLQVYLDEIRRQKGRSWAYVQAVGAESEKLADPAKQIFPLVNSEGKWHHHAGRFPCYFLNQAWAKHMVATWAPRIRELGFDGIHWDTLGRIAGSYSAEIAGTVAFLKTTEPALRPFGLRQTMNFVDLAWWDDSVVSRHVEFPYSEVWSVASEKALFAKMKSPLLGGRWGVVAFYPSVEKPAGATEEQVLIARYREAFRHRLFYLAVGDGDHRVPAAYWPLAPKMTPAEYKALSVRRVTVNSKSRPQPQRPR